MSYSKEIFWQVLHEMYRCAQRSGDFKPIGLNLGDGIKSTKYNFSSRNYMKCADLHGNIISVKPNATGVELGLASPFPRNIL